MSQVIGKYTCPVGGAEAQIQQGNRKGKHFITRCECCGFNQGTGKARQQRIWDEAEWIGETPEPPVNVTVTKSEGSRPKTETEPDRDFEPDLDLVEREEQPKKSKKGLVALVVAGVGVLGGLAAILKA